MFKSSKYKQKQEDTIVDHIIQTYADEGEVESRMRDLINTDYYKKGGHELLSALDRRNTMLYDCRIFDSFKQKLFGSDKHLQILTHTELAVCYLVSTKKYYPEVIADMLWIDDECLQQVVYSLELKLARGGYRLPKGYKAMRPIVEEYFRIKTK